MIIDKKQIEMEGQAQYAKWRQNKSLLNMEKAKVELPDIIDPNFDMIPAPAKALLVDTILNNLIPGQLQNHITWNNGFFEDSDLEYIKKLALKSAKKHGNSEGSVTYDNYDTGEGGTHTKGGGLNGVTGMLYEPEQRVKKTLGQFGYRIDKKTGMLYVSDRFNFNDAPKDQSKGIAQRTKDFKAEKKANDLSATKDTYGTVRKVAKHFGSPEGSGMKFELEIPLGD